MPFAHGDTAWGLIGDGIWNEASHWTDGIPDASDLTTLSNGYTSWIRANAVTDSLSVGNGVAARFHLGKEDDLSLTPTLDTRYAHLGYSAGHQGFANLYNGSWNNTSDIIIGRGGLGIVTMHNEAEMTTNSIDLGYFGGASGSLTLNDDARVNVADVTYIGKSVGSSGTVNMTGGTWANADSLRIAWEGNGEFSASGNSVITAFDAFLGSGNDATGLLDLSGNASFSLDEGFSLGRNGSNATVNLQDHAQLNTGSVTFGENASGGGQANITGGTWTNTGLIGLGNRAAASMEISGTGTVETETFFVGILNGASQLTIGAGGILEIADTLSLGRDETGQGNLAMTGGSLSALHAYLGTFGNSQGTATITDGSFSAAGNVSLGHHAEAEGSVEISGVGSSLTAGNRIYVGNSGTGSLTASDGATLDIGVGHFLFIGTEAGSVGTAVLETGATLDNASSATVVGRAGTGSLSIDSSAFLRNDRTIVAEIGDAEGMLNLTGSAGARGRLVSSTIRTVSENTTRKVNFDGGVFEARENNSELFANFNTGEVEIHDGGAYLDSASFTVATAASFAGFSGSGTLHKEGSGTLTLNGLNAHGGTIVSEGSLIVEGEVTGFVTVSAGATVGGSGVTGQMVLNDAHLAPGSSPGALTVASLTFENATQVEFELGVNPVESDLITVLGTLESDGSGVLFNFIDNGWVDGQTYDLITFGNSTIDLGDYAFTSSAPNLDGEFSQSGNTLQFTTQIVPEPSSCLLLTLASLGLLRRRR